MDCFLQLIRGRSLVLPTSDIKSLFQLIFPQCELPRFNVVENCSSSVEDVLLWDQADQILLVTKLLETANQLALEKKIVPEEHDDAQQVNVVLVFSLLEVFAWKLKEHDTCQARVVLSRTLSDVSSLSALESIVFSDLSGGNDEWRNYLQTTFLGLLLIAYDSKLQANDLLELTSNNIDFAVEILLQLLCTRNCRSFVMLHSTRLLCEFLDPCTFTTLYQVENPKWAAGLTPDLSLSEYFIQEQQLSYSLISNDFCSRICDSFHDSLVGANDANARVLKGLLKRFRENVPKRQTDASRIGVLVHHVVLSSILEFIASLLTVLPGDGSDMRIYLAHGPLLGRLVVPYLKQCALHCSDLNSSSSQALHGTWFEQLNENEMKFIFINSKTGEMVDRLPPNICRLSNFANILGSHHRKRRSKVFQMRQIITDNRKKLVELTEETSVSRQEALRQCAAQGSLSVLRLLHELASGVYAGNAIECALEQALDSGPVLRLVTGHHRLSSVVLRLICVGCKSESRPRLLRKVLQHVGDEHRYSGKHEDGFNAHEMAMKSLQRTSARCAVLVAYLELLTHERLEFSDAMEAAADDQVIREITEPTCAWEDQRNWLECFSPYHGKEYYCYLGDFGISAFDGANRDGQWNESKVGNSGDGDIKEEKASSGDVPVFWQCGSVLRAAWVQQHHGETKGDNTSSQLLNRETGAIYTSISTLREYITTGGKKEHSASMFHASGYQHPEVAPPPPSIPEQQLPRYPATIQ